MKTRPTFALALLLAGCGASLPQVATAVSDFTAAACTLIDGPSSPEWVTLVCDTVDGQGNKAQSIVQVPAASSLGQAMLARRPTAPSASTSTSSSATLAAAHLATLKPATPCTAATVAPTTSASSSARATASSASAPSTPSATPSASAAPAPSASASSRTAPAKK